MKAEAIERYRRTAVQYMDTHWAINRLAYWTAEVKAALAALHEDEA